MKALSLLIAAVLPLLAQTQTLSTEQVYNQSVGSVMTLVASVGRGKVSVGAGFLAVAPGVVVTAWHVVDGARDVAAHFSNGEVVDHLKLIDKDESRDLALLSLPGAARKMLPIHPDRMHTGAKIIAIGAPQGLEFTVSEGIISQYRTMDNLPFYQFSASATHGSSGGPIFNEQGEVVGVVDAGLEDSDSLNFAIPIFSISGLDAHKAPLDWAGVHSNSPASSPGSSGSSNAAADNPNKSSFADIPGKPPAKIPPQLAIDLYQDYRGVLVAACSENDLVYMTKSQPIGQWSVPGELKTAYAKVNAAVKHLNDVSKTTNPDQIVSDAATAIQHLFNYLALFESIDVNTLRNGQRLLSLEQSVRQTKRPTPEYKASISNLMRLVRANLPANYLSPKDSTARYILGRDSFMDDIYDKSGISLDPRYFQCVVMTFERPDQPRTLDNQFVAGDTIVTVDGQSTNTWEELATALKDPTLIHVFVVQKYNSMDLRTMRLLPKPATG